LSYNEKKKKPIAEHGLFAPVSTNNICEYAAFVAALNHIKTHPPTTSKTLVVVDSELVYKQPSVKMELARVTVCTAAGVFV